MYKWMNMRILLFGNSHHSVLKGRQSLDLRIPSRSLHPSSPIHVCVHHKGGPILYCCLLDRRKRGLTSVQVYLSSHFGWYFCLWYRGTEELFCRPFSFCMIMFLSFPSTFSVTWVFEEEETSSDTSTEETKTFSLSWQVSVVHTRQTFLPSRF